MRVREFRRVHRLLLTPRRFIVTSTKSNSGRKRVGRILVIINSPVLSGMTHLGKVNRLLVVNTNVLRAFRLYAIRTSALNRLISNPTPIFPPRLRVGVGTFSNISRHQRPTNPRRAKVTVTLGVRGTVVRTIRSGMIIVTRIGTSKQWGIHRASVKRQIGTGSLILYHRDIRCRPVRTKEGQFVRAKTPIGRRVWSLHHYFIQVF